MTVIMVDFGDRHVEGHTTPEGLPDLAAAWQGVLASHATSGDLEQETKDQMINMLLAEQTSGHDWLLLCAATWLGEQRVTPELRPIIEDGDGLLAVIISTEADGQYRFRTLFEKAKKPEQPN